MKVSQLIERASRDLVDLRFVRWSKAELIDFLNDGIAAVLIRRPDLARVTATVEEHTGNRVTLPNDAYCLLSVNFINDIATQFVDIHKLNQLYPRWRVTQGDPVCWTKNDGDNVSYWLYPSPTTPVTIEHEYSRVTRVDENSDFPLPSIYEGLVLDFIMYRAYSKDSENASEANKAQLHFQAFGVALGDKTQTDTLKKQVRDQKAEG